MKIKDIEDFTLEECREYLNSKSEGELSEKVTERLKYLQSLEKSQKGNIGTPVFISLDELAKNPKYAYANKFNWNYFIKAVLPILLVYVGYRIFLVFLDYGAQMGGVDFILLPLGLIICAVFCLPEKVVFDVEDTESEYKIVRAKILSMGIYRFTNNRAITVAAVRYDKIVYLGDGTYLLKKKDKKGLLNVLSFPAQWVHPMDTCEISWENNIISISKEGHIIKKISTRGFKYEI